MVMDEDTGGPKIPSIRWGCRFPRGRGNFRGCPGHSKALAIFTAAVAAKGLFNCE